MGLCEELLEMYVNSSIDLTVFVSKVIFDANDQQLATECYEQLYAAGATIHLSPWYCTFARRRKHGGCCRA